MNNQHNQHNQALVKIPVTMCHGISERLSRKRLAQRLDIARSMGFISISYSQLYNWLVNDGSIPRQAILFDFDHPVSNIYTTIFPIMQSMGFTGNLFVNTGCYDDRHKVASVKNPEAPYASWLQLREMQQSGWTIGAHTHSHPNLSELSLCDPSGNLVEQDLKKADSIIKSELGFEPEFFAYTGSANGTTWSSLAEEKVMTRYKLARLWVAGNQCEVNGRFQRFADLVGSLDPDEVDGGPPYSTRYISKASNPYRLPAMEMEALIYEEKKFIQYLEEAILT